MTLPCSSSTTRLRMASTMRWSWVAITTVVMATHDERIVDQMRKRVVELEHGKVVRDQERGVYDLGV